MAKAAELAQDYRMSREVISFAETKEGKYRAFIKTSGYVSNVKVERVEENLRIETSFYYVNSTGLSEETAIAILLTMATYAFLGTDYQGIGERCIKELKDGKTKPAKAAAKTTAKEKPAAKAAEETAPEPVEQEEKKAAPARKAPVKKTAPKKPKTIAYDRNQEEHKKQLGTLLNDACPSWGEDGEKTAIAVSLSKGLAGKPFLDTKGEVLQDVIEMITDAFNPVADPTSAL